MHAHRKACFQFGKGTRRVERDIILYIGSFSVSEGNAGAQRALGLSRAFIRQGFKVVTVGSDEDVKLGTPILATCFRYRDIDCYSVRYSRTYTQWLHRILTIQPFIKVARRYGENRIFAIIAMDYETIPLLRLGHWCKKHGAVLICDNIEWYEKSTLPFPMRTVKDIDTCLRMRWYYPRAQAMITISRFLYNKYKTFGFPIVEVPSNIDLSDPKWACLPPLPPGAKRTIAYAGNPGRRCSKERVDCLIRAVCALYAEGLRCRLRLAGFEKQSFEAEFPSLTELPGYSEQIEYLGKLSHEQCMALLNAADFSAIIREDRQSTRAGFPTKLAESLGCGTPVIATPSGNVADYIENGKNGLITDGFSFEAVTDALRRALTMPRPEIRAMHESCRSNPVLDASRFESKITSFIETIKKSLRVGQ
jgi:glycosyltransferase involved in cell wall biosynthesis